MRPAPKDWPLDEPARAVPPPSDPLVRGLSIGKDTDQGVDAGRRVPLGVTMVLCSVAVAHVRPVVVETRRLELLTLSLQRRCSTS